MSRRLIIIAAALLIAITATFLTQRWLGGRLAGAAVAGSPATVDVLVAAQALAPGSVIGAGSLRWAQWPATGSVGLLTSAAVRVETLAGSVVRSAIGAGEPVFAAQLVQPGSAGPMAAIISAGQRAVTISVTPASGMAGFVQAGDRVDLLLTQTIAGGDGLAERHLSRAVLHDLRVLGTDQRGAADAAAAPPEAALEAGNAAALLGAEPGSATAPPTTVTLEVSPKGAEVIAVAAEIGKLSLSLRSLAAGPAVDSGPTWDVDATRLMPRVSTVSRAVAGPGPLASTVAAARPAPVSIVVRGIESGTDNAAPTNSSEAGQ